MLSVPLFSTLETQAFFSSVGFEEIQLVLALVVIRKLGVNLVLGLIIRISGFA